MVDHVYCIGGSVEEVYIFCIFIYIRLVHPIMILDIKLTIIFLPLGKIIRMVRSRTIFILLSWSWEIGTPTGGAGRMKLRCVVPALVIHI